MTGSLTPHPEYQDSCVSCLGKVQLPNAAS